MTLVTEADLARLGPDYDVFDMMRDNCPVCSGAPGHGEQH